RRRGEGAGVMGWQSWVLLVAFLASLAIPGHQFKNRFSGTWRLDGTEEWPPGSLWAQAWFLLWRVGVAWLAVAGLCLLIGGDMEALLLIMAFTPVAFLLMGVI